MEGIQNSYQAVLAQRDSANNEIIQLKEELEQKNNQLEEEIKKKANPVNTGLSTAFNSINQVEDKQGNSESMLKKTEELEKELE